MKRTKPIRVSDDFIRFLDDTRRRQGRPMSYADLADQMAKEIGGDYMSKKKKKRR